MALRDIVDTPVKAKAETKRRVADRDAERARIRAKFSKTDREFIDSVRSVFPSSRLVAVHFNDGEQIGEML